MSIKDFNAQINALETQYHRDLREIIEARDAWISSMWPMYKSGRFDIALMEYDQLECEGSPIGICIYNEFEDAMHDHCVFCGLPEERL